MPARNIPGDHKTMANSLETDQEYAGFFQRNTSALQTAITETLETLLGSATDD